MCTVQHYSKCTGPLLQNFPDNLNYPHILFIACNPQKQEAWSFECHFQYSDANCYATDQDWSKDSEQG